jgi:hypothetical protein
MRGQINNGYRIAFSNKLLLGKIAAKVGMNREKILKYINHCITEYGLFQADKEWFWSDSFLDRMEEYKQLTERRREAGRRGAQARWQGEETNNNAIDSNSKSMVLNGNRIPNRGKPKKFDSIPKQNDSHSPMHSSIHTSIQALGEKSQDGEASPPATAEEIAAILAGNKTANHPRP